MGTAGSEESNYTTRQDLVVNNLQKKTREVRGSLLLYIALELTAKFKEVLLKFVHLLGRL